MPKLKQTTLEKFCEAFWLEIRKQQFIYQISDEELRTSLRWCHSKFYEMKRKDKKTGKWLKCDTTLTVKDIERACKKLDIDIFELLGKVLNDQRTNKTA